MPLNPKDKSNVQSYANLSAPAQLRPHRSKTPQLSSGRDPSLQRQDDDRRKSQGPVLGKENRTLPSREEAAALKVEVPNSRPKSKLAQVTNAKSSKQAEGTQHDVYPGSMPSKHDGHNVCIP
jgi:hypothetical protein